MFGHDIIVVGTSAGGVETLKQLVQGLPSNLPAAIFVVIHFPSHSTSVLPKILNRVSALKASHPEPGTPIEHGRIYVAPPDYHLLIKRGYIHLARGPRENNHRPAIDPLFRTAARFYGERVIGVVLSGNLDDGTAGLLAIKEQGGIAIVQDPEEAMFSGMPRSAIENVEVDHILPISLIAPTLTDLAHQPIAKPSIEPVDETLNIEADIAELDMAALQKEERPGAPSGFGCPECGGALWELSNGRLIRFRCRTGHAYSVETLLAEQKDSLEVALWTAIRALEERAALAHRLVERAQQHNQLLTANRFQAQVDDAHQNAAVIRQVLSKKEGEAEKQWKWQEKELDQGLGASDLISDGSYFIVALVTSKGGLKALTQIVSALPPDFPAALLLLQHLVRDRPSGLAEIIQSQTPLPVKQAQQGDRLYPGTIHIAPPNKHLLVNADATLSLTETELVHFVRPAADLLFESLAINFKERAIAVVLTGYGVDGSTGVQTISAMGGTVIVQDEASSDHFGMPESAIKTGSVDFILPLDKIATTLVELTKPDAIRNSL